MEKILIVDDEPTVLRLCEQILKRGSYSVLAAASGEEALQTLHNNRGPVDLALLDVVLPGMNGVELAARIQTLHPPTKILLMSGFGPKEIARVVGVNPYRIVWKPFRSDSLLRMIENTLSGSPEY